MLATLVDDPFHRTGWVYEEKYDGIRMLAYKDDRRVQLFTRNLKERTADFPGIAAAVAALPAPTLVLDGEVVLLDEDHVSRFQLLQRREVGERSGRPIFAVFDCLYARGHDLRPAPLWRRRAALEAEVQKGSVLVLARRLAPDGLRAFGEAERLGLEGLVAKNEAAPYVADTRSRDWLKVKVRAQEEFVIGGFTAPAGSRTHFGALLVGAHRGGALRYAGKVGTGFTGRTLADLMTRLQRLVRPTSPFADHVRERGVTWVEPRLVAQIAFTELTGDGRLRHPAFLGLRTDKDAAQVRWPRALHTAIVILALGLGLLIGGCATARSRPPVSGRVPQVSSPEAPPPVVGFEQRGNASWYGRRHQGRRTASGELYDMTKLTAAHRTFPLGTVVRVTHVGNGRSVEVRVNDRGPFVDGRIVDISRAAAERLGVLGLGIFPVTLTVVTLP
jgi:bifunctional non-homologous end joining protein LigD